MVASMAKQNASSGILIAAGMMMGATKKNANSLIIAKKKKKSKLKREFSEKKSEERSNENTKFSKVLLCHPSTNRSGHVIPRSAENHTGKTKPKDRKGKRTKRKMIKGTPDNNNRAGSHLKCCLISCREQATGSSSFYTDTESRSASNYRILATPRCPKFGSKHSRISNDTTRQT